MANIRTVQVAGGQLYVSSGSGTTRIATVGTGAPTTTGQTATNLPGTASNNSPYQFVLLRVGNPGFAGPNVLYYADDGTGAGADQIRKFVTTDGTTFVDAGGAPALDIRGLAGMVTGNDNQVTLLATTGGSAAAGGGFLYSFTGTSVFDNIANVPAGTAVGTTLSAAAISIATAPTNTAFRGVQFAPARLEYAGGGFNATSGTAFTNTTNANSPTSFVNAYTANFTQTGLGPVMVGPGVSPAAVVVSNTSGTYTFTNDATAPRGIQGLGTLTKSGAGVLVLNGPNTYAGGTAVNGGSLIAASVGRGPFTVASGAALTAGSRPAGNTVVTPAVLTVSSAAFANGADFGIQLAGTVTTGSNGASGTPGVNNSQIAATVGGVIVNGTRVVVDLTGVTFGSGTSNPYSFTVGTGPGSSTVGGNTFQFTQNGADVTAAITSQFAPSLDITAPNVYLVLVPVPEPMTVLAVAAAGLGGLRLVRRRLTGSSRRPG